MISKFIVTIFIALPLFCFSQTAEAYINMGNAKQNLEDYRGAIQDYNKAIELNPNFAVNT